MIPRAASESHIQMNANVFHFSLTDEEISMITGLVAFTESNSNRRIPGSVQVPMIL